MNSRIYVTGGAGFIGSHLVDRLVDRGEAVTVIDNLSRGRNRNPGAELWAINLERFAPLLTGQSSRVVFHLAAKVTGIEYNRHNHYDMLTSNLRINERVCHMVERARPDLFVFVSTACVYPHDAPIPTPESAAEVCNPEPTNWGYGVAKWTGEQMARYLAIEHNIPTVIVRFFNAFGPRDYYDPGTSHVAPALIKRVVDGENPITVWGTGDQSRSLVDARDIAQALVGIMDNAPHVLSTDPGPLVVNIGHEREITIRELAQTILRCADAPARELVFDTSKPDGYPRRAADTTRLSQLLGWIPDTPLEVTIQDMIVDYQSRGGDSW